MPHAVDRLFRARCIVNCEADAPNSQGQLGSWDQMASHPLKMGLYHRTSLFSQHLQQWRVAARVPSSTHCKKYSPECVRSMKNRNSKFSGIIFKYNLLIHIFSINTGEVRCWPIAAAPQLSFI